MKTSKIVSVYKTMNDSKLTKMEDADKFKVIKALRAIKPISEGYEEFVKLTHEKLKDDKMEEMQKKAQHWQEMQSQSRHFITSSAKCSSRPLLTSSRVSHSN